MSDETGSPEQIGYGRPPRSTRFKRGQSGNPNGRPKGRRRDIPHDHLLGQMVVIREEGRERRVTAAEAFLLHITKRGMEGDSASARASLVAIEEARAKRSYEQAGPSRIVCKSVSPGSVGWALDTLRMAHKARKYSKEACYELHPWLVQLALSRLGSHRLTIQEQTTVIRATRTPHKVVWPDWWEVRP